MRSWLIILCLISFGAFGETYSCCDDDFSSSPYTYWKFEIDDETDQMSIYVAVTSNQDSSEDIEYKAVAGCENAKYQFINSYYIGMFECAQGGQMGNGSFPLASGVAGIISFPKLDAALGLHKSKYSIRCSY